jgi:hypothetical protein
MPSKALAGPMGEKGYGKELSAVGVWATEGLYTSVDMAFCAVDGTCEERCGGDEFDDPDVVRWTTL